MNLDYYEITGLYNEVARFYAMVGDESRYLRFLSIVRDPAAVYERIWSCGGRTFLVVEKKRPVALVDVTPCGKEEVEAAIVVVDSLQGRGYGTKIAEIFAALLPRIGYDKVRAEIHRENIKALAIARRLGADVNCTDVMCTVRLELGRRKGTTQPIVALAATP
ncbi:MAG: GNAT family N-acetyltransferase [Thermoproteus sp.]